MKNKLTIVTVNYFSADLIKKLSKHLPSRQAINYTWVVVDNSDDKAQLVDLQKIDSIDTIISTNSNLGFGKANNLAVNKSSSEYVMLLNPDTTASSLNIKTMIDIIEKDSDIQVVGPKILNTNGTVQLSALKKYPYWWSHQLDYFPILRILLKKLNFNQYPTLLTPKEHGSSQFVVSLLGACMLMRRRDFVKYGGFDEDFFMYREDTDLARRIIEGNNKVYYCAETNLTHISGGASKNNFYAELNRQYTESEYMFLSKWYNFIYVSFCWLIAWIGTLLNSLIFALLGVVRFKKRADYFRISKQSLKCFLQHCVHPFALGYYRRHK